MSTSSSTKSGSDENGGGGSCGGCLVTILLLCALFWGVGTPWGVFHIDLVPPAIRLEPPK